MHLTKQLYLENIAIQFQNRRSKGMGVFFVTKFVSADGQSSSRYSSEYMKI